MSSFFANVTSSVRDSLKMKPPPISELPLFPLDSVLFPGGTLALKIFEQRYLDMAKTCLKDSLPFGIVLIREGEEVGIPAVPESIGTLARVTDWDMQQLGVLQLRVRGAERFKIHSHTVSKNGLIVGQVSMLADELHVDSAEHIACADFLRKVYAKTGAHTTGEQRFDDAAWVGFRVTELLPFNHEIKQKMLELTDARMRIEILFQFLRAQRLLA
jgi:uncharacterized protein